MDWLQFTAAIVGHVAWPAVIIVLFVILRKHMGALADRLLEFSFGGAKITFDKILRTGAEIIEHAPLPELPKPKEPELKLEPPAGTISPDQRRGDIVKRFVARRRAGINNTTLGRIISGLEEVDNLLFDIGDAIGVDAAEASSVLHSLIAQEEIPESFGRLYNTLRDARNLIVHSNALPDEREAIEYVRQTSYLRMYLEFVKSEIAQGKFPAKKRG
jgi:hypothetical protein